jgi:predicted enzyme related to lactoylglutathione lyase
MARHHKQHAQGLVLYAKNKRRVSAFYQRTLDLDIVEESSTHALLQANGTEIVVHAIPRRYSSGIKIAKPPEIRESTPMKPVFFVRDLEAVRAAADATGGGLKPVTSAWRYRGAIVLDGYDPEGNVVQFRQLDP